MGKRKNKNMKRAHRPPLQPPLQKEDVKIVTNETGINNPLNIMNTDTKHPSNIPIFKSPTIFDETVIREEKNQRFTQNLPFQTQSQETGVPLLLPQQKNHDWFTQQQSLPKIPFWNEKVPKVHDLEAEINDAHFKLDSESEDQSDRVVLDPNTALKDHIYQNLDRQGVFLPAFTSTATTIEALENHSHPDFFYILKSDAVMHEDKDHRFRFKLHFVLNILQHYIMETHGKRILPYISAPNKLFLSIVAYHVDPKDTLKLRPKDKPQHAFTIKIQETTGALRSHNQVPQITQLYKHVDQIQNTLNNQRSKEIDTVTQYNALQAKAQLRLANVNSFLNNIEAGIVHQLRDTTVHKNLMLLADSSVPLREMAKLQDQASKDILKKFASEDLIRAYDQSLLKKPEHFYTTIKEKPMKVLNTNATLATADLHDIYKKQGHRYLLAFLKKMNPDKLTAEQNIQLNNIKEEYRGAVEIQRENIRQQISTLRNHYATATAAKRKIAHKFKISCGQNRVDLERYLDLLPSINNLERLHQLRSMTEFHEDNWKKINAKAVNKIDFQLAPKETVNLEVESIDQGLSVASGRTQFEIEGNLQDPFEAFDKINPLTAFIAPSPDRVPSPTRPPAQTRKFFDAVKGFMGIK